MASATVERIGPFDAVDVHVDKARHDRVLPQIEVEIAGRPRRSFPQHVDDAIAVDDDGRRAHQPIGQDDVGVSEEDHGRLDLSQKSLRPSSGRGEALSARKSVAVGVLQQRAQPALVGRRKHDDARALGRREAAVVVVVAVERHERAAELPGEAVVLDVRRPAQVVVLEHEQHVPAERRPHVCRRRRSGCSRRHRCAAARRGVRGGGRARRTECP